MTYLPDPAENFVGDFEARSAFSFSPLVFLLGWNVEGAVDEAPVAELSRVLTEGAAVGEEFVLGEDCAFSISAWVFFSLQLGAMQTQPTIIVHAIRFFIVTDPSPRDVPFPEIPGFWGNPLNWPF